MADIPLSYSNQTGQPVSVSQFGQAAQHGSSSKQTDKSVPRSIPTADSVSYTIPAEESVSQFNPEAQPFSYANPTAVFPTHPYPKPKHVPYSIPSADATSPSNSPAQSIRPVATAKPGIQTTQTTVTTHKAPDHTSGIQLSEIVISTFYKGLKTLDHLLTAAEKYAVETGIHADSFFPDARLIDDMKPLSFQVQNATNTVRKTLSRLAQVKTEVWRDDEQTMEDLHRRIELALDLMDTIDPKRIDARILDVVELPFGNETLKVTAKETALNHGIPNFFFHLQTAYAILRAKGVPLGKRDYLTLFLCL